MFELEIAQAEKNIIEHKRVIWKLQKANELTRKKRLPRYKAEELAEELSYKEDFSMKKGTVKVEFNNVFYLLDLEELFKLPKTQRDKILKIGRINA